MSKFESADPGRSDSNFNVPEEKFSSFKLCRGVERETSEPAVVGAAAIVGNCGQDPDGYTLASLRTASLAPRWSDRPCRHSLRRSGAAASIPWWSTRSTGAWSYFMIWP
jgi:hypothetical protein